MKHLKMLGLAIGVGLLLALVGAGTASATVLCKTESNPCTEYYDAGTVVHAVIELGQEAVLNSTWTDVQCQVSTIQAKTTTTGGIITPVGAYVESLTFESCKCAGGSVGTAHATVLEKGTLSFAHTSGNDGTLTGASQKITVNCTSLGTQCIFGTKGEGTDLGTIQGGSPATTSVNATVNHSSGTNDESSFLCGSTAKWEGNYEITSPNPLHMSVP